MTEYKVKKSKIDYIFITHMHGDHLFGLPGLLNSMSMNDRVRPMTIVGPVGIKAYVEFITSITGGHFRFELNFIELDRDGLVAIGICSGLQVFAFPLKHRIPTYGYKFTEIITYKNIIVEKIAEYSLTHEEIVVAKRGVISCVTVV